MNEKARHANLDERLELLLFDLGGRQRFGINVLKVKEVIGCPALTQVPQSHRAVRGVAHLRGEPLTVIDLASSIGYVSKVDSETAAVIITEFNRKMQGFMVNKVDRIVVCDWKDVLPPPKGSGANSYITGVTDIDNEIIQILDVERVLAEVVRYEIDTIVSVGCEGISGHRVLVVDDSSMARNQTMQTMNSIGIETVMARDGKEALDLLQGIHNSDDMPPVDMVISDIEMPEMDGYSLTKAIRADAQLSHLYVLLHTSLNGAINAEKATESGADAVLTKFVPDELAMAVNNALKSSSSPA